MRSLAGLDVPQADRGVVAAGGHVGPDNDTNNTTNNTTASHLIILLLLLITLLIILVTQYLRLRLGTPDLPTLGGFTGSAAKGQLRKCGSTVMFQSVTTNKQQGKGVQQHGSGIPNQLFVKLTHEPVTSCRPLR